MTKLTPAGSEIVWCVPEQLGNQVYNLSTGEVLNNSDNRGGVLLSTGQSDLVSGADLTYNEYSDKLLGVMKKNLELNLKIRFMRNAEQFMIDQRHWWNSANSFIYPGTLRIKSNQIYSEEPTWREADFRLRDMSMSYEYHPGVIFAEREADAWMLTSEDRYWKHPKQWIEFTNKPGEGWNIRTRNVVDDYAFKLHPSKGTYYKDHPGESSIKYYCDSVVPVWPEIKIEGPLDKPIAFQWTKQWDLTLSRSIQSGETAYIKTDPRVRDAYIANGESIIGDITWDLSPINPQPGKVSTFGVWSGKNTEWNTGKVTISYTAYQNTPF